MDGWYHMHTPQIPPHSLTERPGSLTLLGNGYTLEHDESPAILLTRQLSFKAVSDVDLDFEPQNDGEEAGLAIWYSKWNHARIAVRGEKDKYGKLVKRLLFQQPDYKVAVPIVSSTDRYSFSH